MSGPSKEIRRAVFTTLSHAKFAAAMQKLISEIDGLMSDADLKDDVKTVSTVASAAAIHAWMAMIAMMGNSLDVALNAAQCASEARQVITSIAQKTFLLDVTESDHHELPDDQLPDEHVLGAMWNEFRASLPETFPVPNNTENLLLNKDS